jgi:N-acetylmuramoyl-L-alanine amidase
MPSNLVELGFISQADEASRMARAEYQEVMAEKLYKGLLAYKEIMDK